MQVKVGGCSLEIRGWRSRFRWFSLRLRGAGGGCGCSLGLRGCSLGLRGVVWG